MAGSSDRRNTAPGERVPILSAQETDELRSFGRARRIGRGATLFNEGDRSDHVALLLEGRVKVSFFSDEGREVVLAVREAGDLIGEQAAIDGEPRSANATALGPVTAVILDAAEFRAFLTRNPRVSLSLLKMMSRRLREADRARIEFGIIDTTARVARKLVELAERFGEPNHQGLRLAVSLTQDELAAWVGSSREAVSKALGLLRRRGYIETYRRGITILDLQGLRRRSS